jgi:4-amino-4-deoxy-L-arabinose transferase-like glycosyltransferase
MNSSAREPLDNNAPTGSIARWFWGSRFSAAWLVTGGTLILFLFLGARDLWTMEGRWGVICQQMLRSGDILHPYLFGEPYYDKPLLSYWMMLGFAKLLGSLDEWALRLPGALSGLIAVWCTYRLGRRLVGRAAGLLAGWILLTLYFFVFFGRMAASDMMNVAGTVGAVCWFVERREKPGFVFYAVFFLILALTSLTKGLIGAVVPVVVLAPLLLKGGAWREHVRPALFVSWIPAAIVYLAPFFLSSVHGGEGYQESGLGMVFRENIVRFFQPFDHKGNVFTYFVYLPLYLLPWTLFLPFALGRAVRRWKDTSAGSRWALWASLLILALLTASGSRRGYYILPILPFAALVIAGWVFEERCPRPRVQTAAAWLAAVSAAALLGWFAVAQPIIAARGNLREFAAEVHAAMEAEAPLDRWECMVWKTPPRAAFYLSPLKEAKNMSPGAEKGMGQLEAFLRSNPRTIVVTQERYVGEVLPLMPGGRVMAFQRPVQHALKIGAPEEERVVALLPRPGEG